MRSTMEMFGSRLIAAAWMAGLALAASALASDRMPVAQQNALVQKYCAVCHNDAHVNGGLSLEHFDAARPDPSVAGMLASKLTNVSLETIRQAQTNAAAAATLAKGMSNGAMGAAGVPLPDRPAQNALVSALAAEAAGAGEWNANRTQDLQATVLTASILAEVPAAKRPGEVDLYRLSLICNGDTHQGEMRLAWAPGVPPAGQVLSAAVDGGPPSTYQVEGSEKMFRGTTGTQGTGATVLYATRDESGAPRSMLPLPEQTLTVQDVFPGDTVVFPFRGLSATARQALSACFTRSGAR